MVDYATVSIITTLQQFYIMKGTKFHYYKSR